jgi:putative ABC transport system substrate-binding protein
MGNRMRRREFITTVGGFVMSAASARAQQPAKVARIGYLGLGTMAASATRIEALRTGLKSHGYIEGRNIEIEFRLAENADRLREFATELVGLNVDVIFATSSTEVGAAKEATSTIPIVFATHADPIGTGHIASLAQPGGNITGLSILQSELTAKALEILKEVVPESKRFGVLSSPAVPSHVPTMRAAAAAAEKLGVALHPALVGAVEDFEGAFADMARAGVEGVFVAASSLTVRSRPELLAQLALKYRMPSMFGARDNVILGGLMSHSPDLLELTRRSAIYIDKILRGVQPADLPVEQASQYQLVINLNTARALGLSIPAALMARADEVIE